MSKPAGHRRSDRTLKPKQLNLWEAWSWLQPSRVLDSRVLEGSWPCYRRASKGQELNSKSLLRRNECFPLRGRAAPSCLDARAELCALFPKPSGDEAMTKSHSLLALDSADLAHPAS